MSLIYDIYVLSLYQDKELMKNVIKNSENIIEFVFYEAQKGERIDIIANKIYNNYNMWKVIYAFNDELIECNLRVKTNCILRLPVKIKMEI